MNTIRNALAWVNIYQGDSHCLLDGVDGSMCVQGDVLTLLSRQSLIVQLSYIRNYEVWHRECYDTWGWSNISKAQPSWGVDHERS